MFDDIIQQKKEWAPNKEQKEYLDNLKWQALLTFTLYLDIPDKEEHFYNESVDYILLILQVMKSIKDGGHPNDYDSIERLEYKLELWEEFENTYYDTDEDEEEKEDVMKEVENIMIEASLRPDVE
jgi:hypothetical protein